MADLENSVAATSNTLYRQASVPKRPDCDSRHGALGARQTRFGRTIRHFQNKEAPITTRELLGHFGGIWHDRRHSFDDSEIVNTKHVDPISGGLSFFKDDPLVDAFAALRQV
jgi:hypothetical protein